MKPTQTIVKKPHRKLTRRGSIIKLTVLSVLVLVGLLMSSLSFNIPFVNNGLSKFNSFASSIKLGIDLKGGVYALYEATDEDESNLAERLDGTRARLETLITGKGYTEATVVREGAKRLRAEIPDIDDPQAIFTLIGKPAVITFEIDGNVVLEGSKHIKSASPLSNYQGKPAVELTLTSEGSKIFYDVTSNNIGGSMDIVVTVDGQQQDKTTVNITEPISGGKAVISGGLNSYDAAKQLADQVVSGSFDVKLKLIESSTVSATLGEQALFLAIIAGVIGLVALIVFMCVWYKGLGVVASIAMLLYTVVLLFLLAVVPWVQLTLPGIAGVLLSLGMAVDANIIVFERIKDEYRKGKSLNASLAGGFNRGLLAVVDGNVTTVIAAIVLIIFGSGAVRGFAITLIIGIIASMFSAVFMSNKLLKWVVSIFGDKSVDKKLGLKRDDGVVEIADSSTDTQETVAKPVQPTSEVTV